MMLFWASRCWVENICPLLQMCTIPVVDLNIEYRTVRQAVASGRDVLLDKTEQNTTKSDLPLSDFRLQVH